jgi:hypothetical protein
MNYLSGTVQLCKGMLKHFNKCIRGNDSVIAVMILRALRVSNTKLETSSYVLWRTTDAKQDLSEIVNSLAVNLPAIFGKFREFYWTLRCEMDVVLNRPWHFGKVLGSILNNAPKLESLHLIDPGNILSFLINS